MMTEISPVVTQAAVDTDAGTTQITSIMDINLVITKISAMVTKDSNVAHTASIGHTEPGVANKTIMVHLDPVMREMTKIFPVTTEDVVNMQFSKAILW